MEKDGGGLPQKRVSCFCMTCPKACKPGGWPLKRIITVAVSYDDSSLGYLFHVCGNEVVFIFIAPKLPLQSKMVLHRNEIKTRVQQFLHAETRVLYRFNIHPDVGLSLETNATGRTGRRMGLVINR